MGQQPTPITRLPIIRRLGAGITRTHRVTERPWCRSRRGPAVKSAAKEEQKAGHPLTVVTASSIEAGSMRYLVILSMAALALTACASQQSSTTALQSGLIEARDKLVSDMGQCSQKYGYPEAGTDVPENAIAPNELEWRECAYDAILGYARSNPAMTGKYLQLVDEDQTVTYGIQRHTMTRRDRGAHLNGLLAEMKKMEEEQVQMAK